MSRRKMGAMRAASVLLFGCLGLGCSSKAPAIGADPAPSASVASAASAAPPALAPSAVGSLGAAASASATATASADATALGVPEPPFKGNGNLELSPDGQRFAVTFDGGVLVAPVVGGASVVIPRSMKGSAAVSDMAFSDDASRLALGSGDGSAEILDALSGASLAKLKSPGTPGYVSAVAFSHDGSLLAVSGEHIDLWEIAGKRVVCKAEANNVAQVAFAADGRSFSATGSSRYVTSDASDCHTLAEGSLDTGGTFPSVLSPDGAFVASSEAAGHELNVYATRPFARRGKLPGASSCEDHVGQIRFSDKGALLSAGNNHWVRTYEPKTFRRIGAWQADPQAIPSQIAFFPDGRRFVLVPEKGAPEVFDLKTQKAVCQLQITGHRPSTLEVTATGAFVVGVTPDAVVVWDAATCAKMRDVAPAP